MNAFDYFFEHTSSLNKLFLVGKEEISYKELYDSSLKTAKWLQTKIGQNKNIILLSVNNLFFLKAYLAIIKSGNTCIPLDPKIEYENFRYIYELTKPDLIFISREAEKVLNLKLTFPFFRIHFL